MKSNISSYFFKALKNLHSKYLSFENSYELICINNLIFTENCRIVARFKDYLYLDDSTEFLHKFFQNNELTPILKKTFNFYEKYCKVFPNYMILPENEFLYRNLRKKQKMIDQFNEIKREEEENRKHLKLQKNKNNEKEYILFNKKVQESIEKYKPSFTQSTIIMKDYINFNGNGDINSKKESKILKDINKSKDSITISLNYISNNNYDLNDINTSELTILSIANVINTSPRNTEDNKISLTPRKKILNSLKISSIANGNNENKKFISHYQNMKNIKKKSINNTDIININSDIINNHINININNNKRKKIKNNISNNEINTSAGIKNKVNNFSQSKTSNNLFISSLQKTNKDKKTKNNKSIKTAIHKKKLFFTTTEKTLSHKKPIYNYHYKNKKYDKNSYSTNTKNYKKIYQEINSILIKPSISPSTNKKNSLKLKLIDNIFPRNVKSNKLIYNNSNYNQINHHNISKNDLSNIPKSNKNKKILKLNDKIDNNNKNNKNISRNKVEKKINKNNNINTKINTNVNTNTNSNTNSNKKSVEEIMNNYKNILKKRKNSHYSHDINNDNYFINKNIFLNSEKTNKLNKKSPKNEKQSKYISPVNKVNNSKNIKSPLKPNDLNNQFQKIITKTKQSSQTKIKKFINKILDKNNINNKKNNFISQS